MEENFLIESVWKGFKIIILLNKFLNFFLELGSAMWSLSIRNCLCSREIGISCFVFVTYFNT